MKMSAIAPTPRALLGGPTTRASLNLSTLGRASHGRAPMAMPPTSGTGGLAPGPARADASHCLIWNIWGRTGLEQAWVLVKG
jgi:hypothetical protein